MPTNPNMVAIQTVTVGAGGAAEIAFTSIPQTYTDLVVRLSVRTVFSGGVADDMLLKINGSTSGFSNRYVYGNGSNAFSATAYGNFAGSPDGATATSNTFGSIEVYIPNYAGSNQKSYSINSVSENNATEAIASMIAGLNTTTSAISSLAFYSVGGNNFVQHSTATLYGVKNYALTQVDSGAKARGGIVTSDVNYYYHTFTTSGTFTPTQNLTADYLVVAGGGGGGDVGGGGGAGGYRTSTGAALTGNTNYTVTIGAGGAGSISRATATNGTNSVFSTITASGGGGGGGINASATASGGSGGGGGGGGLGGGTPASAGTGNAGSYSPAEGYAGGVGGTTTWASGGGGGAGAAGTRPNPIDGSSTGGNGGNGLYTAISGGSVTGAGELSGGNYYFAGGGAGAGYGGITPGTAGLGGGGVAKNVNAGTNCTPGTANTGGGGGGAYNSGGAAINPGGSGIVIIRYAK